MENKELTQKNEKPSQCPNDWLKNPCRFEAQNGRKPSVFECYNCMEIAFLSATDEHVAEHFLDIIVVFKMLATKTHQYFRCRTMVKYGRIKITFGEPKKINLDTIVPPHSLTAKLYLVSNIAYTMKKENDKVTLIDVLNRLQLEYQMSPFETEEIINKLVHFTLYEPAGEKLFKT